jgi:hypothetical protein
LRPSSTDVICDPCREAGREAEQVPSEHEDLFRAARALFDNGIENEDEIIPTLVLAANVSQMPHLERIRDGLAKAPRGSKDRAELNAQLYDCFGGLSVVLKSVEEGVPVIREAPFRIIGFRGEDEVVQEVAIDVFKRSATGTEISKWYEWILNRENLGYDLSRGEIAYKYGLSEDQFAYQGGSEFLRILARPEQRSVDQDGSIFPTTPEADMFPPPHVVAEHWEILRNAGFGSRLAGKRQGRPFEARNLVPACVAWYVGERGAVIEQRAMRPKVTKLLNEHLFTPCGKDPVPDTRQNSSHPIWRNTESVAPTILRLEHAIQSGERQLVPHRII